MRPLFPALEAACRYGQATPEDDIMSVRMTGAARAVAGVADVYELPLMLSATHVASLLRKIEASPQAKTLPGNHGSKSKPYDFPDTAELLWPYVKDLSAGAVAVDRRMAFFSITPLTPRRGEVTLHVDDEFEGPDGTIALYTLMVALGDQYTGGQTVFEGPNGLIHAPHVAAGAGLLWPHKVNHGGLRVETGCKLVLITDVFCSRAVESSP